MNHGFFMDWRRTGKGRGLHGRIGLRLLAVLPLSACAATGSQPQLPPVSGTAVQVPESIRGTVRDNQGQPVAGAGVAIADRSVRSGRDGSFRLASRGPGPYVIGIDHPQFAYYSQVIARPGDAGAFRLTRASRTVADPTRRIVLRDERRPEDCRAVEGPAQPSPCGRGILVDIPANALVDASGRPPTGPVEIKLATLEIQTESMPAPFLIAASARDSTPIGVMRPYGAGSVEARDVRTGRSLNLAPGSTARIELPVHRVAAQYTGAAAPPREIPLLRFDRGIERWIQIGTMTLDGDAYTAQVTQLTTFNADTSASIWGCLYITFYGYVPNQIQNLQAEIHVRGSNIPHTSTGAINTSAGGQWRGLFMFKTLGSGSQINFDQHVIYSLESALYYWGEAYNGNTRLTDNNATYSHFLFTQNPLTVGMPSNPMFACTNMNLFWDPSAHKPMFPSWRDVDYLKGPVSFDRSVRIIRALEEPVEIARIEPGRRLEAIGTMRGEPWLVVRTPSGDVGLAPLEGADLSRTRRPERAPGAPAEDRRE